MSVDPPVAPALAWRPLWTAIGRTGVVLAIVLSLLPMPQPLPVPQGDKLGHFLTYFALTAWYAQLAGSTRELALRALGYAALGAALEALQSLTGWRHGNDPFDMLANAAGALAGFAFGVTPARHALRRFEQR